MTPEERIEKYFSGKMDDLERASFDKEVMNNNELASALQEYKKLMTGLKTYGLQKKLNFIMKEQSPDESEPSGRVRAKSKRWYYIMAALLIAAISYYMLNPFTPAIEQNSGPALYIAHYYPDPGLPTKMGVDEDFEFNAGMVEYKNKNYTDAIMHWSALPASRSDVKYYLGAAYLASGSRSKAWEQFNNITSDETFYDRAQWYLALMALEEDNRSRAIGHLKRIQTLNHSNYKERVTELLDKLIQ